MRIALVGLGDIAQKAYLPLVARHREIIPVLCSRNRDVLQELARRYRIEQSYSDYRQLLQSKPDAIMLHTSTQSHFALAQAALKQGIAVFVDKPLSYQLSEAQALIELALQQNIPLFCGFNRRYAPLYQAPLKKSPVSVFYQKNCHRQADDPRIFIYDDFIHLLDFTRHCAGVMPENPWVNPVMQGDKLGSIQVSWAAKGAQYNALMNRISGQADERLEYSALNESWQIDGLASGLYKQHNKHSTLGFNDWDDTLYKRGFVTMIDSFLACVKSVRADVQYLQGVLDSHRLCEQAVKQCG